MNVLDSPSIENVNVGFKGFPETSDRPEPLLDVREPVTLKNSPGSGFAVIGSIAMVAEDLTVIVFRICTACWRSADPLKTKVTFTSPSGWS